MTSEKEPLHYSDSRAGQRFGKQSPQLLHLRIFLSSPGDVTDERALAREAIERIQSERGYRDRLHLEIVAWDKPGAGTPMLATMTPQEAIKKGLPTPAQSIS